MVLDMFCHWNYVLENLFGRGRGGHRQGGHPHPGALGRAGRAVRRHGRRRGVRASSSWPAGSSRRSTPRWAVRVDRKELVEFQVDGTHGSAVAGLFNCRIQPRESTPDAGVEPRPARPTEDFRGQWHEIPDNQEFGNGFRAQWEQFLLDVHARAPAPLRLRRRRARAASSSTPACQSSAEGRRVEMP